ncbi:hypothetical protein D918_07905 [Trichuris suis]|nr:hypothetical protein D918_07905 [Trichuris suis]
MYTGEKLSLRFQLYVAREYDSETFQASAMKSAPEAVDADLFAVGTLKGGRSLPNVHHLSSNNQSLYFGENYANLTSDGTSGEYTDGFVIHPSRGRSPGSRYHYSPYHRSFSPQTTTSSEIFDDKLERQRSLQPLQTQRYLQPPPDTSWRRLEFKILCFNEKYPLLMYTYIRTHSDPVLHSSGDVNAYGTVPIGLTQMNQSLTPPTRSPPLNDSSPCGSPFCEAFASAYYLCPQHEKVFSTARCNEASTVSQGGELESSVYQTETGSSPPSLGTSSPVENPSNGECSCGILPLYSSAMAPNQEVSDGSAGSATQHYSQATRQCPATPFSQYRDSVHSAPCSPSESVSTNEGQSSSSPVPVNMSPSSSYYVLPSQLQNFLIEPIGLQGSRPAVDASDCSYDLLGELASSCGRSTQPANHNEVSPDYADMVNSSCQDVFRMLGAPCYSASMSPKGNIPDIILTGADGSIRNSSMSTSVACPAYYEAGTANPTTIVHAGLGGTNVPLLTHLKQQNDVQPTVVGSKNSILKQL